MVEQPLDSDWAIYLGRQIENDLKSKWKGKLEDVLYYDNSPNNDLRSFLLLVISDDFKKLSKIER